MASSYTNIDLSQLPLPAVVEQIDFDTILGQMLADLVARDSSFTALVPSDPTYKALEVCAYREVLLRQRVNDAAKGVMLAYATGSDLDQVGATFNVARLLLEVGDPNAIPPTADVYEADDDFRRRIQLSFEGYTTAGSAGSYVFHALSADGNVKDVSVVSDVPGQVNVYVLSRIGDGTADSALVQSVAAALNADEVRPMTDLVVVSSAAIVNYAIQAELTLYPGPDSDVVRQAALDAATAHVENIKRLGLDVSRSAILAQLHQPGVQDVNLIAPAANIVVDESEAANCTGVTLTVKAGRNE
jgi:phage-related baseplate assembly protein